MGAISNAIKNLQAEVVQAATTTQQNSTTQESGYLSAEEVLTKFVGDKLMQKMNHMTQTFRDQREEMVGEKRNDYTC